MSEHGGCYHAEDHNIFYTAPAGSKSHVASVEDELAAPWIVRALNRAAAGQQFRPGMCTIFVADYDPATDELLVRDHDGLVLLRMSVASIYRLRSREDTEGYRDFVQNIAEDGAVVIKRVPAERYNALEEEVKVQRREMQRLQTERDGLLEGVRVLQERLETAEAARRSLDEALNSGDGSYKP